MRMNKENNYNQTMDKAITNETSCYCLQMGSKYCKKRMSQPMLWSLSGFD